MTKSAAPLDIGELVPDSPGRGRRASNASGQALQKRQALIVAAIASRAIDGLGIRIAMSAVMEATKKDFTLSEDYCRELWRVNGDAALRDAAVAAIAQRPSEREKITERLERLLEQRR